MTSQRNFLLIFKQIGDISDRTPSKLTYPPKIDGWKMIPFLLKWTLFSFQGTFVHFGGGGTNLIVELIEGNLIYSGQIIATCSRRLVTPNDGLVREFSQHPQKIQV